MATISPYIVVINASEIPDDSMRGSPVPNTEIKLKVLIIPVTVPNNPSNGAVAAVNAMIGISFSKRWAGVQHLFVQHLLQQLLVLIRIFYGTLQHGTGRTTNLLRVIHGVALSVRPEVFQDDLHIAGAGLLDAPNLQPFV